MVQEPDDLLLILEMVLGQRGRDPDFDRKGLRRQGAKEVFVGFIVADRKDEVKGRRTQQFQGHGAFVVAGLLDFDDFAALDDLEFAVVRDQLAQLRL